MKFIYFTLAFCAILFMGLVTWAVIESVSVQQNYQVGHKALCSYFELQQQSTAITIANPPDNDTPKKAELRVKIFQFETAFLKSC